MKLFSMLLISLLCLGGLSGCEGNGEEIDDDMEDAAEEIGDDMEDAGDEIEDAFD